MVIDLVMQIKNEAKQLVAENAELTRKLEDAEFERDELRERLEDDWHYVSLRKQVDALRAKVRTLTDENTRLHAQCYEMDGLTATAKIRELQREVDRLEEDNRRLATHHPPIIEARAIVEAIAVLREELDAEGKLCEELSRLTEQCKAQREELAEARDRGLA